MFVSLNGSLTRGVSGADRARLAAKLGYGGVDWDFGPRNSAGMEATKALFAELKIRPTIVNLPMARPLPFGGDDASFKEALKQLSDDASFCAGIGCDKMMVVLPASTTQPKGEQRKLVRDRLPAISEVLKKSNVSSRSRVPGPAGTSAPVAPEVRHRRRSSGTCPILSLSRRTAVEHRRDSRRRGTGIIPAARRPTSSMPATRASSTCISRMRKPQHQKMCGTINASCRAKASSTSIGFLQALKRIGYRDGISPEPLGRVPQEMSAEEAAAPRARGHAGGHDQEPACKRLRRRLLFRKIGSITTAVLERIRFFGLARSVPLEVARQLTRPARRNTI